MFAALLAGFLAAGAASAQFAQGHGGPAPAYFQPQAAAPMTVHGDASLYNRHPFMQVSACEPSCASPCVVSCAPVCQSACEPSCASSCGGCGRCDNCNDGCDSGCDSCCDPCYRPFYIGLSGGWASRETAQEVGDPATFLQFNDGFHYNVQLGRRFDWVRLEAEISRFNNDVLVAGAGVPGVGNFVGNAAGSVNLTAYMFNAYHDFDIAGWRLDPYVGGGIGVCQSEINGLLPQFFAGAPLNLDNQALNATSDYEFAWQLRAGVNYDWSERTTLFMGYRYFRVEELTFSAFPFGTFNPNGGREHCLEWGLRVAF